MGQPKQRSTGAKCCAGHGPIQLQPITTGCGPIAAISGTDYICLESFDCSGSISTRQLGLFEAEARSILEGQRPQRLYVLYFDAAVHRVDTYGAGERIHLNPVGGGGTAFGPCFEWLEERGILPQCLVFLTDLYGSFPPSAPEYPVLWASTGGSQAPFGEIIPMQAA